MKGIMKKRLLIVSVICVVITLFALYFIQATKNTNVDDQQERELLYSSISSEIARCQSGEIEKVDISKITSFSWDRMYIFDPYTSEREIDETIGIHWSGSKSTFIESSDSITLIVFIDEGTVVQYLEFWREPWDFAYLENDNGYGVDEASFTVDKIGRMHWEFE